MSDNSIDSRQASIVYQNQSHLAFEILKYNKDLEYQSNPAGTEIEAINPKDVVDLALKLTRVAVNPVPHMKRQEESEKVGR